MAPTAAFLWPGHPFDPPSGITQSYSRLWTMTQAYVQQGSGLTGDEGLLANIVRGLDHLSATVYNPSTTRYGNWWEWQPGSPRRQAVRVGSLGLTAANFWAPGTAGPLTATAPASVLVGVRGRTATLCVSEPPRTGAALDITWDRSRTRRRPRERVGRDTGSGRPPSAPPRHSGDGMRGPPM